MHKSRVGHLRVELVMTEEMRHKLQELASGQATSVVISNAMVRHVMVHHVESGASRLREVHFRHVHVDRLEFVSTSHNVPLL